MKKHGKIAWITTNRMKKPEKNGINQYASMKPYSLIPHEKITIN